MNISVILINIHVRNISSAQTGDIKHTDLKIYYSVVKKMKPFNGPFPIYSRVWLRNVLKYQNNILGKFANFVYTYMTREKALPPPIWHAHSKLHILAAKHPANTCSEFVNSELKYMKPS